MTQINFWPYPRVVSTQFHLFLVYLNTITLDMSLYELQTDGLSWNAVLVSSIGSFATGIDYVDVADFGPFYVVCLNGSGGRHTLVRDIDVPLGTSGALVEDTTNRFGACCNYGQVFVGGNFIDHTETVPNGVQWSGFGHYTFDPLVDPTSGRMTLWQSYQADDVVTVQRLLPLQEGVVAYTNHGIALALPTHVQPVATFSQRTLSRLGIANPHHVAGDPSIHGFIDLNYDFWTLETGGKLTKRGYRPYIVALQQVLTPVVVSYLPLDHRFYIANGQNCLVINDFGAYTCHQVPSSVIYEPTSDGIYGMFFDNGQTEAVIVTDEVDFGSRGLKSVESVTAGVLTTDPSVRTSIRVDYSMSTGKDFQARPWVPGGPTAEAVVRTTGLTFRIAAKASTYIGTEFQSLMANVKYSDQRFKRGTVPAQWDIGQA